MNNPHSLKSFFCSDRALDQVITLTNSGDKNFKDLKHDCRSLISSLRNQESKVAVLSCLDSYNFIVGFLALVHEDIKICLPPTIGSGVVSEISSRKLLISDYLPKSLAPIQESDALDIELGELPDTEISLFTSGSTGSRKEIKKNLSHFESEIEVLEELWPIQKQVTISTVSHQHIYGMLFKILWPLSMGAPIYTNECLHESDLKDAFLKYPDARLISCPAHLDNLELFESTHFLRDVETFSSGAPLSLQTSTYIKEITGSAPTEVLGSTETGGIAWRQQTESVEWTKMPKVDIKVEDEDVLYIKSPFCEHKNEWYETSDKARLAGNSRFTHLGRSDRIVKVSGKRLSLTEMEKRLTQSELIEDAKIIILKGKRESCAALLTLRKQGVQELEELGRKKFADQLKKLLKDFYDPVLIPRYWRYIDSLPVNSQGKTSVESLSLFFLGFDEKENRFPDLKEISLTGEQVKLKLIAPANCKFFEGHFDDSPILPGVGQLFWVETFSEKLLGKSNIKGINRLKFHKIILPDTLCELQLTNKVKSVDFKYLCDGEVCSSGSLVYE